MKEIKIDYELTLDGTIIDFETTHWDVKKGELITAGFLSQNGFVMLQRLESTEDEFKKSVIKEVKTKKKPWYAFVKSLEEKFLPIKIHFELQRGERESAFRALLEEELLRHYDLLSDPLFNEEIKRFWAAWRSTHDMVFVSKIVRHNYCCLAKEYYLKLKRIDKLSPSEIRSFPCSAKIEKGYVRKQLGFFVE